MTLIFGDFSDNNPLPLPLAGLDGVKLKLYNGGRGGAWLKGAYDQAKAHGIPATQIGFYSPGDVTPTWAEQKAAAWTIGVDLRDHPWSLDFEFGYTVATIRSTLAAAKADGMTCRGLYQRAYQALGQTWDWRSIAGNRLGNKFPRMLLDQYVTVPFDHDRSDLDAAAWAAATVASYQPPSGGDDVTVDEVAQAFGFSDANSAKIRLDYSAGFQDGAENRTPRQTQTDAYKVGLARGKAVLVDGPVPPGTAFSAVTT